MVRTVGGIFRQAGDKKAREFIRGYVSEQAAKKPTKESVISWLENEYTNRHHDTTLAEYAVKKYNEIEYSNGLVLYTD